MNVRCWLLDSGKGLRDDLGAINQIPRVVTYDGKLGHGSLERVGHLLLLIDEPLPCAGTVTEIRETS
jgi:hypothetical protein